MRQIDVRIILKRVHHAFKDIGSDADKDWRILLVTSVIALVCASIWHARIFLKMHAEGGFASYKAEQRAELIDTMALQEVLFTYDERAKKYSALESSGATFVDPAR